MAFPHTYKNKIELSDNNVKGKKLNSELILKLINIKVNSLKPNDCFLKDGILTYSSKAIFFRFNFMIKIYIEKKGVDHNIIYEIDLDKVLRIIIVGIILMAFFSFLSVKYFLISAGIFSLLFYMLNVLVVSTSVEKIIKNAIAYKYSFNDSEELSEEQQQWLLNENLCPACGEFITNIDIDCPECGLRIKNNKYSVPLDLTKHKHKILKYHYKEKE